MSNEPVFPETAPAEAPKTNELPADTVVVVDDDDATRYTVARSLRGAGYRVVEAATGAQALARAQDQPDLIVLDVKLADIDGYEVCRRLKADPLTRRVPVLQVSAAFTDSEDRAVGLEAGAEGYIASPYGPRELIANVRTLIRARRKEDEAGALRQDLERQVEDRTRDLAKRTRELAVRTAELEARNADQETFVYTVSHDLRQPILAIQGMAELLGEAVRAGDATEADYLVGRITRNTVWMSRLLDDLLELSRVGRVNDEPRPLDLQAAVRARVADLLPGAHVDVEFPDPCPAVLYPPGEADQVIGNLLSNAGKFAGRPGEQPRVLVACSTDGDHVVLRVSDNGQGVPTEHRARVFGLFQKLDSKAEGTGVGLAIVKRIAERHGGRAWVEDSPLGGATFAVSMPRERRSGRDPAPDGRERRRAPG